MVEIASVVWAPVRHRGSHRCALRLDQTTPPYTVPPVATGFVISVFDPVARFDVAFGPLFSHDAVGFLFLPAIVFQGAAEFGSAAFRRNLPCSARWSSSADD